MTEPRKENPLINILLNIALPVWVLHVGAKSTYPRAAEISLVIGLLFPIVYGIWDWKQNHRRNAISLLGIANVLLTGGFALFELTPFWFVVKEATFPLLLGIGVLCTQWFGKQPFFETVMRNSGTLHFDKVDAKVAELQLQTPMKKIFQTSNALFATSFFVSAILNFILAMSVFSSIPTDLSDMQRKSMLNEQIAQMTWKGWVVIALPLTVFMMAVFWLFFKRLKALTGLDFEELSKT